MFIEIGAVMEIETPTGDILNKITILSLKINAMKSNFQLKNIWNELLYLDQVISSTLDPGLFHTKEVQEILTRLSAINNLIWNKNIEVRDAEKNQVFGDPYIEACRSKTKLEDERDDLKGQLSKIFPSQFIEEKSFDEVSDWTPEKDEHDEEDS
jgi:hypothetical protein